MTLKVRRILSLIFIILFLIITPAIVLYAAGYKLGRNGLSIERTGMFIIESKPKGAKIFIDGKAQKTLVSSLFNKNDFITTPAKIKNLLPGEYELSLELDGYSSWRKKLTISPGTSNFVKDAYLFKNGLPIKIASIETEALDFSPDKNQALIISAGRFTLFNLPEETETSAGLKNLKGKNIAWSPDGQKLIIDNYLYDTGDLNSGLDLNKLTPESFNYKWGDGALFYQDKQFIYRLDSENLPKKIIDSLEFEDFLVKNNYLYLISRSEQAASLKIIDLALNEQVKELSLPALANYSFINPEQALINLYDKDHKILYLINTAAHYYQPIAEIINNVKSAFWFDDNNLLYVDDFEVWLYEPASKKKTLITRISDAVIDAVLLPNKSYIIYSTNQAINAIELDGREKRNITELVKLDSIGPLSLSPEGDIIYFSGRIGQAKGLYKLSIQ